MQLAGHHETIARFWLVHRLGDQEGTWVDDAALHNRFMAVLLATSPVADSVVTVLAAATERRRVPVIVL